MSQRGTTEVEVCVELNGLTVPAGTAYISERRGVVSTAFTYASGYLESSKAYDISPDLPLTHGARHNVSRLPGAFSDSAPDRWGRNLIEKWLRAEARRDQRTPPDIAESDFLLGVSDDTRQGALRYRQHGGEFLSQHAQVPKLIHLPRLLHAADAVVADPDEMAGLKLLLDAGSGSLGGARPKASVRDGDHLLIAKFPHHSDDWDVMGWEMTALDLAEMAGIAVPAHRLVTVGSRRALLLDRFDRDGAQRVGFISAMTLTGGADGGSADYLEVGEKILDHGAAVNEDLRQLWRRVAFSLAINNTDDHLRNHGFLRRGAGWRLAPLFDVNPNPDTDSRRATTISYETDPAAWFDALVACAGEFSLTTAQASDVLAEVRVATAGWREVAVRNGINTSECSRFAGAFTPLPKPSFR